MGRIEAQLRDRAALYPGIRVWTGMSPEAFDVVGSAAQNLGCLEEFLCTLAVDADVLSEAIEAAEALGL